MTGSWIKQNDICSENALVGKIEELSGKLTGCIFIAMYTDRFASGNYNRGMEIDGKYLLEIRIFKDDRELLFSRNSISEEFCWRYIQADKAEHESGYIRYHVIDKNENESKCILDNGNLSILSTVGGWYSLPISEKERRIKIMTYVDYDENGMAYVADHRICGFE